MTDKDADYMNGYNACIERIISIINNEILVSKDGNTSVNDVLRLVRKSVLDEGFKALQFIKNK